MRLIFKYIYNFLDDYFHRPKLERCLKNLDLKCKTIIDIGSHIGESISFFSKLYPSSKIFGFEPQNNLMLLFVSTCPVFLNTMFKYGIFRYLNKISPSAYAVFRNMQE